MADPQFDLPMLLGAVVQQGASDLHLTAESSPQFRIHGKLVPAKASVLKSEDTKKLCYSVLTEAQKARFEENRELDFSFGIKNLARFRGNLFYQKGSVSGAFRFIPQEIPAFESLGLPPALKRILSASNGLILVTGPTGSGKSTTLASLIDILNRTQYGHIMTIEDPIEFIHTHKNCIVNQREVGSDTASFSEALRRVLRQDPDYILIGELRDKDTIEMALTAAETGHLVFATLHTNSAIQSIHRIVNVFSPHQQNQVRQMLSMSLQAITCQQLLLLQNRRGRVMACELMIPTMGIRHLIREDKLHQIYSMIQSGQGLTGMQTMNQSLARLVREGKVTRETALAASPLPEELSRVLGGAQVA